MQQVTIDMSLRLRRLIAVWRRYLDLPRIFKTVWTLLMRMIDLMILVMNGRTASGLSGNRSQKVHIEEFFREYRVAGDRVRHS